MHKNGARMRAMKTILLPIIDVEYCCSPRAISGQKVDHMHKGDNTHAIISGPGSRRDGIEMGREQHGVVYS
jgi:hypothetical protein